MHFKQLKKTTNCVQTNCAMKCHIILTVFIIRKKKFLLEYLQSILQA